MADIMEDQYPDRVADCLRDKTILITGATGFVGKVLIEKILRCCPHVKKLYLLIRTKKDKTPNERIREICKGPLFDLVRKTRGDGIFNKLEAVAGDVSAEDLGLAAEDRRKLIDEIQIVYHSAATVRFDEPLKSAVFINVRGTKLMLQLARECKQLQIFTHISTAYCHLHKRILFEKPYPPPASPHHVIEACQWLSDEIVDSITDKLLGNFPNSYAFTKALSEGLINDAIKEGLPVILLRPSIVLPIWKEPLPGWIDNLNGPMGLLIGAGKGVIRSMYCKEDTYADYLPVDVLANAILCTTFDYLTYKSRTIYNLTSSAEYKISFQEIINLGRNIVSNKLPLNGVLWYPGGSMKSSLWLHYICVLMFQLIPAVFLDALLIVLGYKPVLMRVQRRIMKGYDVFEYYTVRQWDFNNDVAMKARELLNPREKATYKVDGDGINYEDYFLSCTHAARLYLLKEGDDTIPAARRHMTIMYWVDKICKTLIMAGLAYFIWTRVLTPIFT